MPNLATKFSLLLFILPAYNPILAGENCESFYYGYLQAKPDMKKAYQCFEAEDNAAMLVIMNYNGEGVPRDLNKALQIAKAKGLTDEYRLSGLMSKIQDELKEAKPVENPQRFVYCSDINIVNMDIEANSSCAEINDQMRNAGLYKRFNDFRSKLSEGQKKELTKAQAIQESLAGSQGELTTFQHRDGSIRSHMPTITALTVKTRSISFIVEKLAAPSLVLQADSDWNEADRLLNQAYRELLKENEQSIRDMAAYRDDAKTRIKEETREFHGLAKKMQLDWIKLRDAYADLGVVLFPKQDPEAVRRTVKTLFSRVRAAEFNQLDGMEN